MSTTTDAGVIAGETGSGKASVQRSLPAAVEAAERQILVRVDRGGILIGERELRYQLQRKDNHPLACEDELLDVLAEIEARGLIEAELCFRLTAEGRARLAEPDTSGRAER
jgi:alpha-D-ribose 1-methylphosphonate 5-triphosphate synthase subunit PhnL